MQLHWLSGTPVLLLLCLLQSANGNVERLAGSTTRAGPTLVPKNGSNVDVCSRLEQRAAALTRTSIPLTITPYYIGFNFPSSARVGETFPVEITAINILSTSLPVLITMVRPPAYEVLGSDVQSVCIAPHGQVITTFTVRPLEAGPAQISVIATIDDSPGCGPKVAARAYHISSPIDIEFPGIPKEKTVTKYLCIGDDYDVEESFAEWLLEVTEASVIAGSVSAWVTVTGSLLGHTLDNLGDLIRMPTGCGEQNMITLTPNIYLLKYLEATNQITSALRATLISNMNAGYQRELYYKLPDGSYNVWGSRDESGSTWLTAFVLKSFAQSKAYIAVDQNEITVSSTWLKNLQLPGGCFSSVGRVIHKEMQGGLGEGGAPGALTAFVLVALLEAGEPRGSPAVLAAKTCVDAATEFGSQGSTDFYLLALKAYAYSLAGFPQAPGAIGNLFSGLSLTSDGLYWKILSSSGSINGALSVETTSYGLLAILTQYGHTLHYTSAQIVKWLSSKMNSHGGFVSTQDTVLALQALARFESLHPQAALGLKVNVVGSSLDVTYEITEANNLVAQRADVSVIPNNIRAEVRGNGCALVQAVVSYSVENPQRSRGLSLQVSGNVGTARDCRFNTFRTCVTYNLKDGKSNMAVIEVTLVTGYTPVRTDLESLVCGGRGNIKLFEVDGSKVIFYVDRLTGNQTCVQFKVSQETVVQNAKNGTVKVYDYYEPELFVTETFAFDQRNCASKK